MQLGLEFFHLLESWDKVGMLVVIIVAKFPGLGLLVICYLTLIFSSNVAQVGTSGAGLLPHVVRVVDASALVLVPAGPAKDLLFLQAWLVGWFDASLSTFTEATTETSRWVASGCEGSCSTPKVAFSRASSSCLKGR